MPSSSWSLFSFWTAAGVIGEAFGARLTTTANISRRPRPITAPMVFSYTVSLLKSNSFISLYLPQKIAGRFFQAVNVRLKHHHASWIEGRVREAAQPQNALL